MTDQIVNTVLSLGNLIGNIVSPLLPEKRQDTADAVATVVVKEVREMLPQTGRGFFFLAGLSGATAVIMGAYGAHVFRSSEADPALKYTYETGSRYHFFHTLALLAIPLTRRPYIVGSLLCSGMLLFSGSCYYHALTSNNTVRKVTPYGGILLILGWIAMIL